MSKGKSNKKIKRCSFSNAPSYYNNKRRAQYNTEEHIKQLERNFVEKMVRRFSF